MPPDLEPVPVMANGQPNPTGTGRYCLPPPGTCYCGECPWWRPAPPPNYGQAIRQLAEAERSKSGRKRRNNW